MSVYPISEDDQAGIELESGFIPVGAPDLYYLEDHGDLKRNNWKLGLPGWIVDDPALQDDGKWESGDPIGQVFYTKIGAVFEPEAHIWLGIVNGGCIIGTREAIEAVGGKVLGLADEIARRMAR